MFGKAFPIEEFLKFNVLIEREHLQPAMMNEIEFENFYNQHSRSLWAYVRRIANSAEIADDITQESFMRFLGATRRTDTNEKAYLYRIATNLVYDSFRRSTRERKRREIATEEPVYEQFAAESEMTKVFDKLKPQERALLWLAYVEGYQHSEIAETLNLKSLSVRVLLFRARRKLIALLETEKIEMKGI